MLFYKGLFFYSLRILFSLFSISRFPFFHILVFISLFIAQISCVCIILNKFCPLLNCHFPSLLINTSMFAYRTNGLKL